MNAGTKLEPGYVVQLNPETCNNKMLAGCMMIVTDPKGFGAQGYIQMTGSNGERGGQAYYRAIWAEMELVGQSVWVVT